MAGEQFRKKSLKRIGTKFVAFLLWSIAGTAAVMGQITVEVLDYEDQSPVDHAAIVLQKQFGDDISFTDRLGVAILDTGGLKTRLISFSQVDYYDQVLSLDQLQQQNYKVQLRPLFSRFKVYVVTPSKRSESETDIVVSSRQINRKQFEMQVPQTSADLLKSSGSVFIQKSQMGGGSPMIRGFAANRVLLVMDGVRINNAIFRDGNVHSVISIDPNMLEKVEVYEGPGSVIFGSDALGGVMHFKTMELETTDSLMPDKVYEGNTSIQMHSANRSTSWHVNFKVRARNWASLTGVSLSNYNSLRMGSRGADSFLSRYYVEHVDSQDVMVENDRTLRQEFSGYSQANISQKFLYQVDSNFKLQVGFFFATTSPVPRYDRLSEFNGENLRYAEWNYGPQKWLMTYARMTMKLKSSWIDQLSFQGAVQKIEESRMTRNFGDTLRTTRRENLQLVTINMDADKKVNNRLALYYGIETLSNHLNSTANQFHIHHLTEQDIDDTRYPDSSKWMANSAYLTSKFALDSNWTARAGIRYNAVSLFAPIRSGLATTFSEIDRYFPGINGSLGLNYHPDTRTKLMINIASGFRAPNIDDVGKIFDSQPGKITVPNASLNPEQVLSGDVTFARRPNHKSEFSVGAFYSIWDGPIQRGSFQVDGQDSLTYEGELREVQALVNGEQAQLYGFHFQGLYRFSTKLKVQANYNWQQGQTSDNQPIRHIAPAFGQVHWIHTTEKFRLDLYMEFNGEISADDLALEERDKAHLYAKDNTGQPYSPGWYTINVKAVYSHSAKTNFSFGVENILDQHYRPYSSGISAPGINAIFSLRTRF